MRWFALLLLLFLASPVAADPPAPAGATIDGGSTNHTTSGNTTSLATTSGTLTSGDCAEWDASGNAIASGAACGGACSSLDCSGVDHVIEPTGGDAVIKLGAYGFQVRQTDDDNLFRVQNDSGYIFINEASTAIADGLQFLVWYFGNSASATDRLTIDYSTVAQPEIRSNRNGAILRIRSAGEINFWGDGAGDDHEFWVGSTLVLDVAGDGTDNTVRAICDSTQGATSDCFRVEDSAANPLFSVDTTSAQVDVGGTLRDVHAVGYGGMYVKDLATSGTDHTFSGSTFEKITDFAVAMAEAGAVTSSHANDELTLADAGDYELCLSADFDGSATQTVRCCVFIGPAGSEVESIPCMGGRRMGGTADEGSSGGHCAFVAASADDRVELHCQSANLETVDWTWLSITAEWQGP